MSRSELEFRIIMAQVANHKVRFTARLERNIRTEPGPMGTPCKIWTGASRGGKYRGTYPSMNFRFEGKHTTVDVHRVFLIMTLGRPISDGMECGHLCHNSKCCCHVEETTRQENLWARNNRREGRTPPT